MDSPLSPSSSSSLASPLSSANQADEETKRRQESVNQFIEIVGNSVTVESGNRLLESFGWNLENALAVHFAQNDEDVQVNSIHAQPNTNRLFPSRSDDSTTRFPVYQHVTLPTVSDEDAHPTRGTSHLDLHHPISSSSPSNSLMALVVSIGRFIRTCSSILSSNAVSILRLFFPSFLSSALNMETYGQMDFNVYFQNQFGSPKPSFYGGSFSEACEHAKRTNRVLVVYLHLSSPSASYYPRLFQNEVFLDLLNQSGVMWATFGMRLEGQMLRRRILHGTSLPHLSILAPTTTSGTEEASALIDHPFSFAQTQRRFLEGFRIIGSLEREVSDIDEGLRLLTSAIEFVDHEKTQNDLALSRLEEDRKLRHEQDRAYAAAVEKDRELAAKAREREEREETEQLKRKQKAVSLSRLRAEQWARGQQFFREELKRPRSETEEETLRIRLRLPDGVRLERQFFIYAPLSHLFLWVDGVADFTRETDGVSQPGDYVERLMRSSHSPDGDCNGQSFDLACVTKILGQVSNPTPSRPPNIPLQFYLSAPFRVQKIERPAADAIDFPTLRELGLESDLVLYLHISDEDQEDATN